MLSSRAANTVETQRPSRACEWICTRRSIRATVRSTSVWITYDILGVNWSPHPTEEEVRGEYEQIWSHLGRRTIEELIETPLMSDSACLATLDVLTKVVPPAMFRDANLGSLAICRAVNLSLEHGFSDGSSFVFVYLGMVAGPHWEITMQDFRFGQLGYELTERRGLKRFQARTYMCFGSHVHPMDETCPGLPRLDTSSVRSRVTRLETSFCGVQPQQRDYEPSGDGRPARGCTT